MYPSLFLLDYAKTNNLQYYVRFRLLVELCLKGALSQGHRAENDSHKGSIASIVIGIDHGTVCAGVVGNAIRHSTSCAGRCAAISILPRSQCYKRQRKPALSTSCTTVRPDWRLRNDAWRRDSWWRHNWLVTSQSTGHEPRAQRQTLVFTPKVA